MVTMVETAHLPSKTITMVTKVPRVLDAITYAQEVIATMRRCAKAVSPTRWHIRDERGELVAFVYIEADGAFGTIAGEAHWTVRRSEA